MGIRPGDGTVSIDLGVIAIPGRCAIISFCVIVVAVAMAADVEQLVLRAVGSIVVKVGELALEALPLGQVVTVIVPIGRIGAVDEAEVGGHEIEGCCIC